MNFNVGVGTDIGKRRSQNQDHCASHPELGFFVVSDGMGGHRGGETASATAVEIITSQILAVQKASQWDPSKVLREAISLANQIIFEKSIVSPELQGMGTTTTALLFKDRLL